MGMSLILMHWFFVANRTNLMNQCANLVNAPKRARGVPGKLLKG